MIIENQSRLGAGQLSALRAEGKARRYGCDRPVEVFELAEGVYSIFSRSPGMGGDAWMHLVTGPERAVLIDTGFGIGDLRALVETLTDKPYDVFNTHFHGDHTLGNVQFDRVFIHRYDLSPLAGSMTPEGRRAFIPVEGDYYGPEDVPPFRPYGIVPVDAGFTFDLGGGETLELLHIPGHSAGCAGLLDRKRRILFSGDALCCTPTFIFGPLPEVEHREYMTIRAYREGLLRLEKRLGEFDTLYPGHGFLGVPNEIVSDTVKVCDAVIADPDRYDDILRFGSQEGMIRKIGWGSVAFSKDRV